MCVVQVWQQKGNLDCGIAMNVVRRDFLTVSFAVDRLIVFDSRSLDTTCLTSSLSAQPKLISTQISSIYILLRSQHSTVY